MIVWFKAYRARKAAEREARAVEASALARGDARVPGATRGRIYTREGEPANGIINLYTQRKATVRITVTRADGTVEDHGVVEASVAP